MNNIDINTILCPTDFSDAGKEAVRYALSLAQGFGAKVILLHVVEPVEFYPAQLHDPELGTRVKEELEKEAREMMSQMEQHFSAEHLETQIVVGKAHTAVLEKAEELGADLIVIGSTGRSGLSHLLLGSTAERVVRQSKCPVFTVRPREEENKES